MSDAVWNAVTEPGTLTLAEATALDDPQDKETPPSEEEQKFTGQLRMAYWLARVYGDRLLFVHDVDEWHVWDGTRGARDSKHVARRFVIACLHDATIVLRDDDHDGVGNIFSVIFPTPAPGSGLVASLSQ